MGRKKWDRIRLENREERREDNEGKQRDGKIKKKSEVFFKKKKGRK